MNENSDYIEFVEKAQHGDKKSLNYLAELSRERLRLYVYRLTLNDDLAQEIVQESMLEMCKILGKLKRADRFWPWLYGIAINKLHRYHRTERTRKKVDMSKAKHHGSLKQRQQGLENIVSQELKQIVSAAMQKLKTRHKAVLVMRCYDEMSYSEIAESMGCSEFSTRMLFLRAKKSLQKELARNGFGKGSLLAALVLFGKMTAPTEAAAAQVSVTASTTGVGLLANLVSLVISKTAIVSLTTAGVLATGTIVVTSSMPGKKAIVTGEKPFVSSQVASPLGQAGNSSEQYWYYFPDGPTGPMMMRAKSIQEGEKSAVKPLSKPPSAVQVLQNDRANYYYSDRTIRINNHRLFNADLSVFKMPTDHPSLVEFISQIEGSDTQIEYISGKGKGLMVIATRNEDKTSEHPWMIRHYNVLDEDYFQSDWPTGYRIIDNRDAMHKRGWTFFTIAGQINGQVVSGRGRMPFVYAASKYLSPWLELSIGSDLKIVDIVSGALIFGTGRAPIARYKAGTFFKGLARPWMGLHTLDTIRRDAAEQRIWFQTKKSPTIGKIDVELTCEQIKLIYTIDPETDIIDEIKFSKDDSDIGFLRLTYLQDITDVADEFAQPKRYSSRRIKQKELGLLWLVQLATGTLEN
jgi:RNA polymerase sigma-70 factor (ECF subfamily)